MKTFLYVGEGFTPRTFWIFRSHPTAYQPQMSPQIQKILVAKPSPIPKA